MQQASLRLLEAIHEAQLSFIAEPDNRRAFDLLLEKLLELTNSEYGFIGEIFASGKEPPFLKVHAITDISWDEETRKLFELHAAGGLEFRNLKTLFGTVIVSGKTLISNDPANDPRSGGLPSGHPDLNAFLGIPFFHGERLIGMVGVANRPVGYDDEIVEFLSPFLATCALLIHARQERSAQLRLEKEQRAIELQRLENRRLKSLMELAGNLAHDLNNSLTAIMGVSEIEMHRRDKTEKPPTDSMEIIRTAAQQASELSQQLLNYSGRSGVERTEVGIGQLLQEIVQVCKALAEPDIEIDCEMAIAEVIVKGDATALKQVFMNLVVNAIESIDGKGTVRLNVSAEPPKTLLVEISDTGCGVPPEQLSRIWDPYYSTKRNGRGLGLASVWGILASHGGTISIDSEVNKGTRVTVALPSVTKPQPTVDVVPTVITDTNVDRDLLIVDDNLTVLKVISRVVALIGFSPIETSSGREAIEQLNKMTSQPSCAIVDLTMPIMDGIETFRQLRAIYPKLPVVFMTGFTNRDVPEDFLQQQNTAFMKKPFSIQQLRSVLQSVVDS